LSDKFSQDIGHHIPLEKNKPTTEALRHGERLLKFQENQRLLELLDRD
jgi:hypothetical protein